MKIATNISAMLAWRFVSRTDEGMQKTLQRLSTGSRINSAADDAAGLGISERLKGQVSGLKVSARNCLDGVSLAQTAEGALSNIQSILQRMRELAVQADNDTYSSADKLQIQGEIENLLDELEHIATTTKFNGIDLINAGSVATSATGGITLHIGADYNDTMNFKFAAANITALGTGTFMLDELRAGQGCPVGGAGSDPQSAIRAIDAAIDTVSTQRTTLGVIQNRLTFTIEGLNIAVENLGAAKSRIADADMALEMAEFTKQQVLMQSGTAMLAQANQKPQYILKLLQ